MTKYLQIFFLQLFLGVACLAMLMTSSVAAEEDRRAASESGAELVFPQERDWVEVPIRLEDTAIVLTLRINDAEPVEAVLDTGASTALLFDHEIAKTIDFDITGPVQVRGAGQDDAMPKVELAQKVRFGLGDVTLGNLEMAVMRDVNPMVKMNWQAVIGHQIFQNLIVQMDWSAQVLRLADPKHFEAPDTASVVPIERRGGHIFIRGELVLNEDDPHGEIRPVELVVDSGAFHDLLLDPSKTGEPVKDRIENTTLGSGLNGVVTGSIGRISSLKIGDFRFDDVETRFPDAAFADVLTIGSDGNLGAGWLRRFLVTFDYSRDQMWLEPAAAEADPSAFSDLREQP